MTVSGKKNERKNNRRNRRERGQAATEYVMFLVVIVSIVLVVGVAFTNKIRQLFEGKIGQSIQRQFSPKGLHKLSPPMPK